MAKIIRQKTKPVQNIYIVQMKKNMMFGLFLGCRAYLVAAVSIASTWSQFTR
jgi:hypothetical protein